MTTHLEKIAARFDVFDLRSHTMALAIVGSDAHGTKIPPESGGIDDTDYMGIVIPPARHIIGLGSWEHWVYGPDESGLDVTTYALKKFIGLLLKSNPNVIGFLWMRPESYVHRTPELDMLLEARDAFSSRQAYPAFVGYANSQLKKMEANVFHGYMGAKRKKLVERFGFDTKNASHLIRLLRTGVEFLTTGTMNVYRAADAAELMEIKRGAWSLAKVKSESERLFEIAREAIQNSPLPEFPDVQRAEDLLMRLTSGSLSRNA